MYLFYLLVSLFIYLFLISELSQIDFYAETMWGENLA